MLQRILGECRLISNLPGKASKTLVESRGLPSDSICVLEGELGKLDIKIGKKAKIRNLYNQVLHLTQETTWGSDNNTRKYHIQETQEVSAFPTGDHKAAMSRQDSTKDTKHKYKKLSTKEAPPWNGQ